MLPIDTHTNKQTLLQSDLMKHTFSTRVEKATLSHKHTMTYDPHTEEGTKIKTEDSLASFTLLCKCTHMQTKLTNNN